MIQGLGRRGRCCQARLACQASVAAWPGFQRGGRSVLQQLRSQSASSSRSRHLPELSVLPAGARAVILRHPKLMVVATASLAAATLSWKPLSSVTAGVRTLHPRLANTNAGVAAAQAVQAAPGIGDASATAAVQLAGATVCPRSRLPQLELLVLRHYKRSQPRAVAWPTG